MTMTNTYQKMKIKEFYVLITKDFNHAKLCA